MKPLINGSGSGAKRTFWQRERMVAGSRAMRDVVSTPFTYGGIYDMVRRGPDVVAGWISRYADAPISLVRLTP